LRRVPKMEEAASFALGCALTQLAVYKTATLALNELQPPRIFTQFETSRNFPEYKGISVSKKKQLATVLVAEADFNSALSRLLRAKPIKKNDIQISKRKPGKIIGARP
jgi:hypothetical protein